MIFEREPAIILGLVNTALALILSFGVSLSADQIGAILAFSSALIALITRQVVTSPATRSTLLPPPKS